MNSEAATVRDCACRCGGVEARLSYPVSAPPPPARECDCDYCREHDGVWLSAPKGAMKIRSALTLIEQRQGSLQARFLHCPDCGDLIAVVAEFEGRLLGALRASLLPDREDNARSVPSSPKTLSPKAKAARWQELWTPTVIEQA